MGRNSSKSMLSKSRSRSRRSTCSKASKPRLSKRKSSNALMLPTSQSGYNSRYSGYTSRSAGSGRSSRSSVSRSDIDKLRSGKSFIPSANDWKSSGNMISVDENQFAYMEMLISKLQMRCEDLEIENDALHNIPIKDVLKFLINNSNTAHVTIGDEVCPFGWRVELSVFARSRK